MHAYPCLDSATKGFNRLEKAVRGSDNLARCCCWRCCCMLRWRG